MKPLYFLKQRGEITFMLIVFSIIYSSCAEEKDVYASIDSSTQKQGSSGGSSQNTKSSYKPNVQTYLRIWLTDTRIAIDNLEPSTEYDPLNPPFNTEYNPVRSTNKNLPNNQIGISFGPEFIQKGGLINSGSTKIVTTFNYIELPVLFSYRHNYDGRHKAYGRGGALFCLWCWRQY